MTFQINIHTPGQHTKDVLALISEYEKRISRFADIKWIFTKSGTKEEENKALRISLSGLSYIVLDETGKNITTPEIASVFSHYMSSGNPMLHIVIGGAFGLDEDIIRAAKASWAFGKITLPHQLVRLIASEQAYRAMAIINNHPYHHG